MHASHFITHNIQGLRITKMCNFYCFIRILSETGIITISCECLSVMNKMTTWCHEFYPALLLHHGCKHQHSEKGKYHLRTFTKDSLDILKGTQGSPGICR